MNRTSLLGNLNSCLNNCATLSSKGGNDTQFVGRLILQLTRYKGQLERVYEERPRNEDITQLIDFCERMLAWIKTVPTEELRGRCTSLATSISVSKIKLDTAGRPAYEITKDSLQELANAGFSWTQISVLFGVTRRTITSRVAKYGIQKTITNPRISDADLIDKLEQLHRRYPQAGYRMMAAFLKAEGVVVPLARVNKELSLLYPEDTELRWKAMAKRRHYNVPGANSLWHMDGHHKLIRWSFVVHAGCDGFSRAITFVHCSDNNRRGTVFVQFMEGVRQFGLPSRVRGDYGGENKDVMLTGRKFWRDLFRLALVPFYDHFTQLEKEGLLDVENNKCMAALHAVYLDRINTVLKQFQTGWNGHRMSSEKNWTPNQMWQNSMLQRASEDCTLEEATKYGQDWNGLNSNNTVTQVVVDSEKIKLPDVVKTALRDQLGVATEDDFVNDDGTERYLKALDIITRNW